MEKFADVKPGDIIQFRDVKIVTKTVTNVPGGGTRTSTATQQMGQHTAIISANLEKGKFKVLEQNAGPATNDEKMRKSVRVVIKDALVDTGATLLSPPTKVIRELGLQAVSKKKVTSSVGTAETTLYDTARLTIHTVRKRSRARIGQLPTINPFSAISASLCRATVGQMWLGSAYTTSPG